MLKEFILYQQALELKELGFDESCFGYYNNKKELTFNINNNPVSKDYIWVGNEIIPIEMILAPTFSQIFRWFREKYDFHYTIQRSKKYVGITYSSIVNFSIDEFDTYEEAELECIKKLIEYITTNKI